jgi:hypothetical protein
VISLEIREKQIRRMGGLDNYPSFEPGGYAELVRIAGKYGRSPEHLIAIMDEITENYMKCPKPLEFKALLEVGKPAFVKRDCQDCSGSGWKYANNGGVMRCPCGSVPGTGEFSYNKREKLDRLKEFINLDETKDFQ